MIMKKQEKKNWEFLFLGANMDAITAAHSIGIRADRATRYECDSIGTDTNYRALGKALSKYRACKAEAVGEALADWDAEISEDFESRKA